MEIEDYLGKDAIIRGLEQLSEDLEDFEGMEQIVIAWSKNGNVRHRLFGTNTEVVGFLEEVKFVFLRETIGETREE